MIKISKSKQAHLKNLSQYTVKVETIIESLQHMIKADKDFVIFMDMKNHEKKVSASEVYDISIGVAQYFISKGLKKNDKVIIMIPTSIEFVFIYFGILMAGGIPVPVSQPAGTANIEKFLDNLKHIIRDSESKFFATFDKLKMMIGGLIDAPNPIEEFIFTGDVLKNPIPKKNYTDLPKITGDDLALIQYTSGTTGHPKGVMLSHKNLIHNLHGIGIASNMVETDVGISWLPLYHDMGLIGGLLTTVYWGMSLVLMTPEAFLFRPQWWLENISKYRVTIGVAPNFGYHYCTTRVPDSEVTKLNLSSWRLALNGAEPIDQTTLQKFINKFKPGGLRKDIFLPVYGMAENSLAATFPALDNTTVVRRFCRVKLEEDHYATDTNSKNSKEYIDLVAVGFPLLGQEVRIANDNWKTLKEREVGQILVKSQSLSSGYYKNEKATNETIKEGWFSTGDMGFILEGHLYISGRKKEIIIKRGKNIYPYDVERIASTIKGVRLGCCAAFASENINQGTEDLILVCETTVKDINQQKVIIKNIRNEILAKLGIAPDDIKLVPKGTVPKTTSGKTQRVLCKKIYLQNDFIKMRGRNNFVLARTFVLSLFQLLRLKMKKKSNYNDMAN